MDMARTASIIGLAFATVVGSGCTANGLHRRGDDPLTPKERNRPIAAAVGAGSCLLFAKAGSPAGLGAAVLCGGVGYFLADKFSDGCTLVQKGSMETVVTEKNGVVVDRTQRRTTKDQYYCETPATRPDSFYTPQSQPSLGQR